MQVLTYLVLVIGLICVFIIITFIWACVKIRQERILRERRNNGQARIQNEIRNITNPE